MVLRDLKDPQVRREAVEKELRVRLENIGSSSVDSDTAQKRNCENMIGWSQMPLGIAGPLIVKREKRKEKSYYIPLATTEGALVASINRGCKAITKAGGTLAFTFNKGVTRGPVFYTGSIQETHKLHSFIKNHESRIKSQAESTSTYLKLKKMSLSSLTNYTFVRFSYDTTDAMGMNMATIATQKAVELIENETGIKCLSVGGNFDTDKKPAWINFINHRGHKGWADVVLPKKVVSEILKTTPQKFFDTWLAKCMLGSAMSGALGFNAHFANVVAAIFLATGQDPAHVVEGSMGVTTAKVLENGDLYVGVYLPALMVGTVGGGTSLPTQKEALKILGVSGSGNVEEFAEIVAGVVLAGEISLLASLSEGTLAKAHTILARNPKSQILNSI